MVYDKKSFLAGLSVGIQLKGWMSPTKGSAEDPWVTFENGVLTIYQAHEATPNGDKLEVK